ncbi:MAG: hypothetical protein V3T05_01515 [Myxococcota bacterium]
MSRGRWRPPPMDEKPAEAEPKVKVDEQVVRKMLKVNPDMRQGRTTFQVKKSLERGEPIGTASSSEPAAAPAVQSGPASAAQSGSGKELQDTIDFFVRGKTAALDEKLDAVSARRQALDDEEKTLRDEMAKQLVSFVSLLDDKTVATHGRSALAKHSALLAKVGLDVALLLGKAKGKGK